LGRKGSEGRITVEKENTKEYLTEEYGHQTRTRRDSVFKPERTRSVSDKKENPSKRDDGGGGRTTNW